MATLDTDPIEINSPTSSPSTTRKKRKSRVRIDPATPIYLRHSWTFWYDESGAETKESSLKKIGSFKTIQGFWQYYNQLVDPSKFPETSNLRLFKESISPPLLSNVQNKLGGKWTIPCSKRDTGATWMKVLLALLGEQFESSHELCGVILSVRPVLDNVILWNSNALSQGIEGITTQLRKLVQTTHTLTYRPHSQIAVNNTLNSNRISSPTMELHFSEHVIMNNEPSVKHDHHSHNHVSKDAPGAGMTRKMVSACDLAHEETAAKIKHKKSSSFSNTQFPDMEGPAWKKHRKTASDSLKKSMIYRTTSRKSVSFNSSDSAKLNCSCQSSTVALDRTPYGASTSSGKSNVSQAVRIAFVLVFFLLVLSGYILTPQ